MRNPRRTASPISAPAGVVRLDDGFLITPTDACLGFLDPAQLARTDALARQIGGLPASKTLALHARIYDKAGRFDTKTRCVLHTHSTHCVSLTLDQSRSELLPAITPYFVMKVGHVPVIPYDRPGAPETVKAVAEAIDRYAACSTPLRAVMLDRLGPMVWHDSPVAAMTVLEELEESARLSRLCPDAVPLDDEALEQLRRAFGARW